MASYPPRSDTRLMALDSVAVIAESSEKEEEEEGDKGIEKMDLSTSRHSPKRSRSEGDEVTSKNTSSAELRLEEVDPRSALDVSPISSGPPLCKKLRSDAWDLDEMFEDDDSE